MFDNLAKATFFVRARAPTKAHNQGGLADIPQQPNVRTIDGLHRGREWAADHRSTHSQATPVLPQIPPPQPSGTISRLISKSGSVVCLQSNRRSPALRRIGPHLDDEPLQIQCREQHLTFNVAHASPRALAIAWLQLGLAGHSILQVASRDPVFGIGNTRLRGARKQREGFEFPSPLDQSDGPFKARRWRVRDR